MGSGRQRASGRRSPDRARSAGAPRAAPMWQEAMRRRRYLRDRAEAVAAAAAGGGGDGDGLQRSRDWLYESYYCMSQQHPLIVFLLLIVMGACVALLAVFFALQLVSDFPRDLPRALPIPSGEGPSPPLPRPARGGPSLSAPCPSCRPEAGLALARAAGTRKVSLDGSAPNKVARVFARWTAGACVSPPREPAGELRGTPRPGRCLPPRSHASQPNQPAAPAAAAYLLSWCFSFN